MSVDPRMNTKPCPICRTPEADVQFSYERSTGGPVALVTCDTCGHFIVATDGQADAWTEDLSDIERGALMGVLRRATERNDGKPTRLDASLTPRLIADSGRPSNVDELVTHLLTLVARAAPAFGTCSDFVSLDVWSARCFMYPRESFSKLKQTLELRGWLTTFGPRTGTDHRIALELTLLGWQEYHARQRRGIDSTSAFIATWGGAQMKGAPIEALRAAVLEAGLHPIVGIELSGVNRVTEDIEAGIRRSRFLIADFTGGRAAVSWEAGFARGLGLPVIYTCHASSTGEVIVRDQAGSSGAPGIVSKPWREQLQFDTTQFPHIFWETPEELKAKVLSKIRAEGWDEPKARRS